MDNSLAQKQPAPAAPADLEKLRAKVIFACTIGGALEWFDFGLYGLFALYIGKTFFPAGNSTVSLIIVFSTYALGFVVRPLGALLIGRYADRQGRKKALSLSMLMMAVGMLIMVVTPSYASIGIASPLIIMAARIIQGLSTGGEIGGALSFLVETAPAEKRGYYASFQQLSQTGSFILAGGTVWALTALLGEHLITSGAWRIPFAFGLLIAPLGYYVRRQLDETPLFEQQLAGGTAPHSPLSEAFTHNLPELLCGIGIVALWTACSKITSSFMPAYAVKELHMSIDSPYLGLLAVGIALLGAPWVGKLADRVGRKILMCGSAALMILTVYPSFWILDHFRTPWVLIAQQFFLGVLMVIYSGPASAMLAELFPTRTRSTAVGASYNISVTVFGGFAPLFATLLVEWTGDPKSVALYFILAGVLSLVSVWLAPDKTGRVID